MYMIFGSQESERISVVHNYNHAFRGFSAMLTESEASVLSGSFSCLSLLFIYFRSSTYIFFFSIFNSLCDFKKWPGRKYNSFAIIILADNDFFPKGT